MCGKIACGKVACGKIASITRISGKNRGIDSTIKDLLLSQC